MILILDDSFFFRQAHDLAKYGTCTRLRVGALLVKDNRVISIGYNGTAHGLEHCHHFDDKPCHKNVHAEMNVIVFAAKLGISTQDTTMYVTHLPCDGCAGPIINAGVSIVKYYSPYRNDNGLFSLEKAGLLVERYYEEDEGPE